MFNIQNLTNKSIRFQDAIIEPYGTVSVANVYDYITLAQLTNSGKARYFTTVDVPKDEVKETKPVEKVEAKTEVTKVEEKLPEVKEEKEPEKVETTEKEVKTEKQTRTYNKKNKKSKED